MTKNNTMYRGFQISQLNCDDLECKVIGERDIVKEINMELLLKPIEEGVIKRVCVMYEGLLFRIVGLEYDITGNYRSCNIGLVATLYNEDTNKYKKVNINGFEKYPKAKVGERLTSDLIHMYLLLIENDASDNFTDYEEFTKELQNATEEIVSDPENVTEAPYIAVEKIEPETKEAKNIIKEDGGFDE